MNWKKWALVGLVVAGIAGAAAWTTVIPTYDSWKFLAPTEFVQTVTIDNPPSGNALNVAGPAAFTSTVTMTGQPAIDGGLYTNGLNVVGPVVQGSGAVSFDAGVYAKTLAVGAGGTPLTWSCKGTVIFDAPALRGDGTTQQCATTNAVASCPGALFGDSCSVGWDQSFVTGYLTGLDNVSILPRLSGADSARVVICAQGFLDGGIVDLPDASYTVRCFR